MIVIAITSQLPPVVDADEYYAVLPSGYSVNVDNTVRYLKVRSFYGNVVINGVSNALVDISLAAGSTLSSSISVGRGSSVTVRGGAVSSNFPPAFAMVDDSSFLRFVNTTFNNGTVLDATINSTCILRYMGNTTFLGETFPYYTLTHRQERVFLRFPVSTKYYGFGVKAAPAGGKLVLIGQDKAVVKSANLWAWVVAGDAVIISAVGNAGDTWELVNIKGWNDGDVPAFGVEISTTFSSKVYKILAAPAAGLPLQLKFSLPAVRFRVIHAKNTTNVAVDVIDGGIVVAEVPQTDDYKYMGYTAQVGSVIFSLAGATSGVFELNVEALTRNYFGNYFRVVGALSGLAAVQRVEPDYSLLPAEGYIAYLDGNLRDLTLAVNRVAFLARTFASEGISLRGALNDTFCIPLLAEDALIDALGSNYAVKVVPMDDGSMVVNIFCATQQDEAIAFARAAALLNSLKGVITPLLPQGESIDFVIKVIHRSE